ncbi:MAG: hypothetical protein AAGF11_32875 [Myxococcota bacterium]
MLRHFIAITALLLTACPDDSGSDGDDSGSGSGSGSGSSAGSADETGTPMIEVPTDAAALLTWLEAESYSGWSAESAIHDQTGNSPHGRVLVYFNDVLDASFDAGNTNHTVGSASVKELYDAADARIGWAVMVKVTDGEDANSWYWYLNANGSVNADGTGVGGCEGCHSAGVDRVITAYPLD